MSPNILAILVAFGLGLVLIPWKIALQKIGNDNFFMVLGAVLFTGGLINSLFKKIEKDFSFDFSAVAWAIIAGVIYFVTMTIFNKALNHPLAKLGIIAAISATYPVIAGIASMIIFKQTLSLKEILFMLVSIAGIVGLSVVGKR
ncbi:MAG: EamA family transporter [Parcubacteria group bacterium]|nr:EamA family transporter [Parcubacteria group bacterium]